MVIIVTRPINFDKFNKYHRIIHIIALYILTFINIINIPFFIDSSNILIIAFLIYQFF
jgi:hypothetical protein